MGTLKKCPSSKAKITRTNRAEEEASSQPHDERTAVDIAQHFLDGLWQTHTQRVNFTRAFEKPPKVENIQEGKEIRTLERIVRLGDTGECQPQTFFLLQ